MKALEPLVRAKLNELTLTVSLRRAGHSEEAVSRVNTDVGRRLMEESQGVVSEMRNAEEALLQQRTAAAQVAQRRTAVIVFGGGAALLVLLLLAAYWTARAQGQLETERERAVFLASTGAVLAASLDVDEITPEEPLGTQTAPVLAASLDVDEITRRLVRQMVPVVADNVTVDLLTEAGQVIRVAEAAVDPVKEEALRGMRRFPPGPDRPGSPVFEAIRTRKLVFIPHFEPIDMQRVAEANDEYLTLIARVAPRSSVTVPLMARGQAIGAMSFGISESARLYTQDDLRLAEAIAERASLSIENARLYVEERRAKDQAAFLAEASRLLASSLDFEGTLKTVVQIVVPRMADWCSVEMKQADGSTEPTAVAHVDPAKLELAWALRKKYPPDPASSVGLPNVLRTGRSEFFEDIPDEMLVAMTVDADHLRLARELGLKSALVVAINGPGGVIGALTLVQSESGRRFRSGDVRFGEDLANRMGLAITNATLYREVKQAVELRDDFLSIASHELKTPITSLSLTLGNLIRAAEKGRLLELGNAGTAERLSKVAKQTSRLNDVINQLLDVSRISAGRLTLEKQKIDLVEIIRDVVDRLSEIAEQHQAPVSLEATGPIEGLWDRERLDQVVTNLVSNAIKYGAGKPVLVRVTVPDSSQVEVIVQDQGVGIDSDDQGRIFERFERAASSRNFGGLGLGLWITRQIVTAHGGQVSFVSKIGEGATFKVQLPL